MLRSWWRRFAGRKAQPPRRAGSPAACRKRSYRLQFELLEDRMAPATHTWTGASTVDGIISIVAASSIGPDAPNVCPIFPFKLLTGISEPKTAAIARASAESP